LFVQKARLPVLEIVPLSEIAPDAVERLLDTAFEPERKRRTSYLIRANQPWLPALSFAARDAAGVFCGQLQCTRVALTTDDGAEHPVTFVGPLAVLPSHQATGVGRALMNALMAAEAQQQPDTDAFAVIGDPDYFTRLFGFRADLTQGWELPGPVDRHRLLAKVSRAGGLPEHARFGPAVQSDAPFALTQTTA
jgi:predicted N-acetyltransferase YhbS